jgi:hypothetical protein
MAPTINSYQLTMVVIFNHAVAATDAQKSYQKAKIITMRLGKPLMIALDRRQTLYGWAALLDWGTPA